MYTRRGCRGSLVRDVEKRTKMREEDDDQSFSKRGKGPKVAAG